MTSQRSLNLSPPPGLYKPHSSSSGAIGRIFPGVGGQTAQAWMVTFTDLIALMLTFFVLVFSMSSLDQVRWQNLVDSLALDLDAVREYSVPVPRESLTIDRQTNLPGNNLDYLNNVLGEQLAGAQNLSELVIDHQGDRLVIRLDQAFASVSNSNSAADAVPSQDKVQLGLLTIADTAVAPLFALGGVLRGVDHRIEIAVTGSSWAVAVDGAKTVARALREAGYGGQPQILGRASQSAPILEIVISSHRGRDEL